jgi:hypothetical protein
MGSRLLLQESNFKMYLYFRVRKYAETIVKEIEANTITHNESIFDNSKILF